MQYTELDTLTSRMSDAAFESAISLVRSMRQARAQGAAEFRQLDIATMGLATKYANAQARAAKQTRWERRMEELIIRYGLHELQACAICAQEGLSIKDSW